MRSTFIIEMPVLPKQINLLAIRLHILIVVRRIIAFAKSQPLSFILVVSLVVGALFSLTSARDISYLNIIFLIVSQIRIAILIYWHRKDEIFLMNIRADYKFIFGIETIILSLPIILLLAFSRYWYIIFFSTAASIGFGLLEPTYRRLRNNRKFFTVTKHLPLNAIEWKAGIRKKGYLFLLLYIVGAVVVISGVSISLVLLTCLLLVFVYVVTSFFDQCESRQIIELHGCSPKEFLFAKLRAAWILFVIFTLPIAIEFLIVRVDAWFILFAVYILCSSIFSSAIILKYAFYHEGGSAKLECGSAMGWVLLSHAIFPFSLLVQSYYFVKAKNKLENYLYAFHS